MKTLITGSYGRVGTAVIDELGDSYEFIHFDLFNHPKLDTICGNIDDYTKVDSAVGENVENIIHLAAASRVDSSWPEVLQSNIIGSYNCLESARRNEVNKVVLASTNHVVGMYEKEHKPAIYQKNFPLKLDKNSQVRPDSYYAASKIFMESIGRYYSENYEYPKRVYVLRLGSIRDPCKDHPYSDAEEWFRQNEGNKNGEEYQLKVNRMKGLWQSRRDLAHMVECCLEDNTVDYDIFYGVSDNSRSWLDIEHSKKVLDYNPEDSSDNWNKPPDKDFLEKKLDKSSYILNK